MKTEVLDTISEYFITVGPLLKKKLFRNFPINKIPHNLSRSNWEVLFTLFDMRQATVTDLCKQLGISRPNMTPLVDKLVLQGWVDRRTSEADRRVIFIEITPAGDQICKEIHGQLMEQIKSKLAPLDYDNLIELEKCMITLKSIAAKIEL